MDDAIDDRVERHSATESASYDDEVVLVGVVQFRQKPKGAQVIAVRSMIRLVSLYVCELTTAYEIANPFDMTSRESFSIASSLEGPRPIEIDGELFPALLALPPSVTRVPADDQLTENVIERRTQIMGDLPDPYAPLGRCLDAIGGMKSVRSCLGIVLTETGYAYVTIKEPLTLKLESTDLILCFSNFRTWAIERMHEASSDND